jgi:hypothetical protein
MELLQTVRECASVKDSLLTEFSEAYRSLSITTGYHGYASLKKELLTSEMAPKINAGTGNVA